MWTSRATSDKDPAQFEEQAELADKTLVIPTRNLVLASLPHTEVHRIVSSAKPIRLAAGDEIYDAGDRIDDLFFPVDCVMSAAVLLEDGTSVELSMTGREGIVGLAALLGGGRALHWTRVSVAGTALRVAKPFMQEIFAKSEAVQEGVLRAYRSLFTQVCQRSVCNTRHSLLQRLCVWLLMMQDRVGTDELPFTQDDIASRISVRRAGVSVAASMLQSMHGISYHRGKILILDRELLVNTACECYGVLQEEFKSGSWRGAALNFLLERRQLTAKKESREEGIK